MKESLEKALKHEHVATLGKKYNRRYAWGIRLPIEYVSNEPAVQAELFGSPCYRGAFGGNFLYRLERACG